jgi:hypothetical protein
MPKRPSKITPAGGEAGKWHAFYTGPGYNVTKDDVLRYGEGVGMSKVYWATEASNYSGHYNGDTYILYEDKENLPEAMRPDAARAEEIEQRKRDEAEAHMLISVDRSQIDKDNNKLRVPLVQNGRLVDGFVDMTDIKFTDLKDGRYNADLGAGNMQHNVTRPDHEDEPISSRRLKNMVDNANSYIVNRELQQWREAQSSVTPFNIDDIDEDDVPF